MVKKQFRKPGSMILGLMAGWLMTGLCLPLWAQEPEQPGIACEPVLVEGDPDESINLMVVTNKGVDLGKAADFIDNSDEEKLDLLDYLSTVKPFDQYIDENKLHIYLVKNREIDLGCCNLAFSWDSVTCDPQKVEKAAMACVRNGNIPDEILVLSQNTSGADFCTSVNAVQEAEQRNNLEAVKARLPEDIDICEDICNKNLELHGVTLEHCRLEGCAIDAFFGPIQEVCDECALNNFQGTFAREGITYNCSDWVQACADLQNTRSELESPSQGSGIFGGFLGAGKFGEHAVLYGIESSPLPFIVPTLLGMSMAQLTLEEPQRENQIVEFNGSALDVVAAANHEQFALCPSFHESKAQVGEEERVAQCIEGNRPTPLIPVETKLWRDHDNDLMRADISERLTPPKPGEEFNPNDIDFSIFRPGSADFQALEMGLNLHSRSAVAPATVRLPFSTLTNFDIQFNQRNADKERRTLLEEADFNISIPGFDDWPSNFFDQIGEYVEELSDRLEDEDWLLGFVLADSLGIDSEILVWVGIGILFLAGGFIFGFIAVIAFVFGGSLVIGIDLSGCSEYGFIGSQVGVTFKLKELRSEPLLDENGYRIIWSGSMGAGGNSRLAGTRGTARIEFDLAFWDWAKETDCENIPLILDLWAVKDIPLEIKTKVTYPLAGALFGEVNETIEEVLIGGHPPHTNNISFSDNQNGTPGPYGTLRAGTFAGRHVDVIRDTIGGQDEEDHIYGNILGRYEDDLRHFQTQLEGEGGFRDRLSEARDQRGFLTYSETRIGSHYLQFYDFMTQLVGNPFYKEIVKQTQYYHNHTTTFWKQIFQHPSKIQGTRVPPSIQADFVMIHPQTKEMKTIQVTQDEIIFDGFLKHSLPSPNLAVDQGHSDDEFLNGFTDVNFNDLEGILTEDYSGYISDLMSPVPPDAGVDQNFVSLKLPQAYVNSQLGVLSGDGFTDKSKTFPIADDDLFPKRFQGNRLPYEITELTFNFTPETAPYIDFDDSLDPILDLQDLKAKLLGRSELQFKFLIRDPSQIPMDQERVVSNNTLNAPALDIKVPLTLQHRDFRLAGGGHYTFAESILTSKIGRLNGEDSLEVNLSLEPNCPFEGIEGATTLCEVFVALRDRNPDRFDLFLKNLQAELEQYAAAQVPRGTRGAPLLLTRDLDLNFNILPRGDERFKGIGGDFWGHDGATGWDMDFNPVNYPDGKFMLQIHTLEQNDRHLETVLGLSNKPPSGVPPSPAFVSKIEKIAYKIGVPAGVEIPFGKCEDGVDGTRHCQCKLQPNPTIETRTCLNALYELDTEKEGEGLFTYAKIKAYTLNDKLLANFNGRVWDTPRDAFQEHTFFIALNPATYLDMKDHINRGGEGGTLLKASAFTATNAILFRTENAVGIQADRLCKPTVPMDLSPEPSQENFFLPISADHEGGMDEEGLTADIFPRNNKATVSEADSRKKSPNDVYVMCRDEDKEDHPGVFGTPPGSYWGPSFVPDIPDNPFIIDDSLFPTFDVNNLDIYSGSSPHLDSGEPIFLPSSGSDSSVPLNALPETGTSGSSTQPELYFAPTDTQPSNDSNLYYNTSGTYSPSYNTGTGGSTYTMQPSSPPAESTSSTTTSSYSSYTTTSSSTTSTGTSYGSTYSTTSSGTYISTSSSSSTGTVSGSGTTSPTTSTTTYPYPTGNNSAFYFY